MKRMLWILLPPAFHRVVPVPGQRSPEQWCYHVHKSCAASHGVNNLLHRISGRAQYVLPDTANARQMFEHFLFEGKGFQSC